MREDSFKWKKKREKKIKGVEVFKDTVVYFILVIYWNIYQVFFFKLIFNYKNFKKQLGFNTNKLVS